jgi:quinol-cytochrome oxidoreductase complex cytochrome b subunit
MDWRRRLKEVFRLEATLPPHINILHYLGSLAFLLFSIEVVSGVLLMIYYRPAAGEAYQSIRYIMTDVRLGWLVRGVHRWAGDLLILVILLHLLRVYFYGTYKHPRELNWTVGILLLGFTIGFGFTGTLLPWDQGAFWTINYAQEAISSVPILGRLFLDFLWGGPELGSAALLRFYVFHVGILPWIFAPLLLLHLYLAIYHGIGERR